MVKQLLNFTRGSSDDPVPVNVATLLHEVSALIRQSFPKTMTIHCTVSDADSNGQTLSIVEADPTKMQQVVMNLCVNARDAMPEGGVLTISAFNRLVDDAFADAHLDAQPGHYVAIAVKDTGTGISPNVCDRMFDPFFTTKDVGKGTGLGLSTVLGIVQSQGGFITVNTEVGTGTTMTVYWPAMQASASSPALTATQPADLIRGNGEQVLVVDDDPAVQRTLQALLQSHDYHPIVANSGDEAIALYRQHHDIRLVVMDVMMPEMGGEELMRHLKKVHPEVRAIALSGLPANRDPMLAAGVQAFLSKPYTLDTLLQTIQTVMVQP